MKKIKKNESGRSMVEMLGVLAIIGVLSVGGISGYKMAMEKITTNEILQLVDKFWLGYLSESENPDSSIYQTTMTNYFSAHPTLENSEYSQLFSNLYGMNDCSVGFANLCDESSYAWGVNAFDHELNGTLLELVLVVPRSTCEAVLNYVAQNTQMMDNFRQVLYGRALAKTSMTPEGIRNFCQNTLKAWNYAPLKTHVAVPISFYLPYEIE